MNGDDTSYTTAGVAWTSADWTTTTTTLPSSGTFTVYTDPAGEIRWAIREWFANKGISLFTEEEALICFYMQRFGTELEKECREFLPMIVRRRVVDGD